MVGQPKENKSPNSDVMVYDIPISSHLEYNENPIRNNENPMRNNEIINNEIPNSVLWNILKGISIILSLYIGLWVISASIIAIGFTDYTFIVFSKAMMISVFVSFGFLLVVGITMNVIYDKNHYSQ